MPFKILIILTISLPAAGGKKSGTKSKSPGRSYSSSLSRSSSIGVLNQVRLGLREEIAACWVPCTHWWNDQSEELVQGHSTLRGMGDVLYLSTPPTAYLLPSLTHFQTPICYSLSPAVVMYRRTHSFLTL